jgi:hypothetical protein
MRSRRARIPTARRRPAHCLPLATLVAVAVAVAGGAAEAASAAYGKSELRGLRRASCPPPSKPLTSSHFSQGQVQDARKRHLFKVGPYSGVKLVPRVNWLKDPHNSKRFRNALHAMTWLGVLRYDYRRGHVGALVQARRLLLDWIRHQKRGAPGTSQSAWRSKITGDRATELGYLVRAAACRHRLPRPQALAALRSVRAHAKWLIHNRDPMNHGLFDSIGLLALGRDFRFMKDAREWRQLGKRRFVNLFHARVIEKEGFWLENSSAYQFLLTSLLARFQATTGHRRPGLRHLLERMRNVGGWLIEPDRRIPPFGDSHMITPSRGYQRRAANDRGMLALMKSGIAVIKAPGAFLSMLADFHNDTHKHADELSFDLFDREQRIVTDTGQYHTQPGPIRDFAVSARAHNTLTVRAQRPRRDKRPYGSALQARGSDAGWFAVRGKNPQLRRRGVRHWRLFLYKPHVALIVVDRVRADRSRTYRRYFHLGPNVAVTQNGPRTLGLQAPGFSGSLYSESGAGTENRTLARGRTDPLAGWTSPSYRDFLPRWTVRLQSSGRNRSYVTTISLDPSQLRANLGRVGQRRVKLELNSHGTPAGTLAIRRSGSRLTVNPNP